MAGSSGYVAAASTRSDGVWRSTLGAACFVFAVPSAFLFAWPTSSDAAVTYVSWLSMPLGMALFWRWPRTPTLLQAGVITLIWTVILGLAFRTWFETLPLFLQWTLRDIGRLMSIVLVSLILGRAKGLKEAGVGRH
jgi:hypothetical protein